jgi:hypothetical protein
MTRIDKTVCQHRVSPWDRHVPVYRFTDVTIEIMPVMLNEHFLADLGVHWIKRNFSLWVQLKITEHPVEAEALLWALQDMLTLRRSQVIYQPARV